jgi:hypothetical protein
MLEEKHTRRGYRQHKGHDHEQYLLNSHCRCEWTFVWIQGLGCLRSTMGCLRFYRGPVPLLSEVYPFMMPLDKLACNEVPTSRTFVR